MTVPTEKFEKVCRDEGVIPTALKHSTEHGVMRFAEAYHHANPEHTISGVIVPGWRTLWVMDRDGSDYFGVLWFRAGTIQQARFNTAKEDADQFIADNLEVGRY